MGANGFTETRKMGVGDSVLFCETDDDLTDRREVPMGNIRKEMVDGLEIEPAETVIDPRIPGAEVSARQHLMDVPVFPSGPGLNQSRFVNMSDLKNQGEDRTKHGVKQGE